MDDGHRFRSNKRYIVLQHLVSLSMYDVSQLPSFLFPLGPFYK